MNFDAEPTFTHPNRTAKKPKKHPERDLQIECINWFRNHYKNALIFSIPNEFARKEMEAAKPMGLLKGASDIIIVINGKVLFIEFKSDTGTLTREQKTFQHKVEQNGFNYFIIRDITTFKNVIIGNYQSL